MPTRARLLRPRFVRAGHGLFRRTVPSRTDHLVPSYPSRLVRSSVRSRARVLDLRGSAAPAAPNQAAASSITRIDVGRYHQSIFVPPSPAQVGRRSPQRSPRSTAACLMKWPPRCPGRQRAGAVRMTVVVVNVALSGSSRRNPAQSTLGMLAHAGSVVAPAPATQRPCDDPALLLSSEIQCAGYPSCGPPHGQTNRTPGEPVVVSGDPTHPGGGGASPI
jgi:hypothetical protein